MIVLAQPIHGSPAWRQPPTCIAVTVRVLVAFEALEHVIAGVVAGVAGQAGGVV